MRKIFKPFLILLSVAFLSGCNDDDCGECFTPPEPFLFDIINNSDENVFKIGAYDPEEIEIINLDDNSSVEFTFIDDNLIQINTIGWKTETINYSFNISGENIFDLYVDAERLSEDCCAYTRYNEVKIKDAAVNPLPGTRTYRITVE